MAHSCVQVQDSCNVLGVDHGEIQNVIEPILAESVPVLSRNGQCILLAAQQAIELEFDLEGFSRLESPQVNVFETGISAKHIRADPVADENANHGFGNCVTKCGHDSNDD